MSLLNRFYPEARFGGFTHLDGTLAFYSRLQAMAQPDWVVIDFGCGRGAYGDDPIAYRRQARIFRGKVKEVIGLDVTAAAAGNPFVDRFLPLQGNAWQVADESVNLVICDNVLEHLPEPAAFFREARRVLRVGGVVAIRTPNRWNYIALIAQFLPQRAHAGVLKTAKSELRAEDVFPAHYRCNSLSAVRKALMAHQFEPCVFGYEAEPSYLSFSAVAYALGVLHQRVAPGVFKAAIFAYGRKNTD